MMRLEESAQLRYANAYTGKTAHKWGVRGTRVLRPHKICNDNRLSGRWAIDIIHKHVSLTWQETRPPSKPPSLWMNIMIKVIKPQYRVARYICHAFRGASINEAIAKRKTTYPYCPPIGLLTS